MPSCIPPSLLAPKHWPLWSLIGLLRLLALLPYPLLMRIGKGLGYLYLPLSGRRRRIASTNLTLCFPELTTQQRNALLRDNYASMGQGLMEISMAWWWPDQRLKKLLLQVEGLEHLARNDSPKGSILLTAHFTSLELSARIMAMYDEGYGVYRKNENPVIQWAFENYRGRCGRGIIDRNNLRKIVRALRANAAVWLAPDQNFGKKGSVFAYFMGVPAATTTAVSRYAEWGNAQVIPFCFWRDKQGYRLELTPPLDNFPSGDDQYDTQRINDYFSQCVRQHPSQYNWIHRRFKTRPDNAPSFYS